MVYRNINIKKRDINVRLHIALYNLIEYENELRSIGQGLIWGETFFGQSIPNSRFFRSLCKRCGTPMRCEEEDVCNDHYCEMCSPKHAFTR